MTACDKSVTCKIESTYNISQRQYASHKVQNVVMTIPTGRSTDQEPLKLTLDLLNFIQEDKGELTIEADNFVKQQTEILLQTLKWN